MKVFIENEAGTDQKKIFDEKTLEYKKTVTVSRKYPYPYGFILETTGEDGDNADCFIITDKRIMSGEIVECEPIGLMEQFEKSWDPTKNNIEEQDHNVLVVPVGENTSILDQKIKDVLTDFVLHVFDHVKINKNRVGNFLNKQAAEEYIKHSTDKK